jgi:glycine/D-amino acid oxidase-like deaminating enzyme
MGTDKMLELVEMRFKGLERIQKYFKNSVIDFDLCGGYELYDDNTTSSELLQENIQYLNSLLKPIVDSKKTYRLADEKIKTFGFGNTKHLVENHLEGYLHSGRLVQGLLHKVQGLGVQVLTSLQIKSFENNGQKIEIHTDQGFSLPASQLLLCTNAFAKELLPEIDVIPARGQVLLTSPIKDLPWQGTFHSDEGYYYFRNLDNRVLLGGARNKAFEEERTTDMNTSDFIQQHLQNYLDEVVLPNHKGTYTIESRWSGIMAMGTEKMPIVKQLQPNIFCAIRMSGMGVALAPVVGDQVARMMRG